MRAHGDWIGGARRRRALAMVGAGALRSLCAMRIQLIAIAILLGSQGCAADLDDEPVADDPSAATATDHLKEIFDEVDGARITQLMREMSGVTPVVVNGRTITLGQRFNATGRQNFRDYWTQAMRNLGLETTAFHYQAAGHPRAGDNVEAVLRGPSPNSFIVIVHYDSI